MGVAGIQSDPGSNLRRGKFLTETIARYGHLNSDPYAHTEAALFRTLDPPSEQNED